MTEVFNISDHSYYGILDLKAFAAQAGLAVKREIETKGKAHLLQHLLKNDCEVIYDEKGKPYIKNSGIHISVSHSHDRLALMVNHHEPTGIDIELIRPNVTNIKTKFLDETELADAGDDIEKLLVYWAAKETLYKIYGLKEVNFIGHLWIEPFAYASKGLLKGWIRLGHFKKAFELRYQKTENYMLVYALHEIKKSA